jgi:hypothetical protein
MLANVALLVDTTKSLSSAERSHSPADGRANASPAVRWNALLDSRSLLNYLIRPQQQRWWDREAENLGRL